MLYVFGVAELPISISGDPAKRNTLTYTVRGVGQATNALVNSGRNDWIGVRGPFGRGWPMKQAEGKDVLAVAGGIGSRRCGRRSTTCWLIANSTVALLSSMAPAARAICCFSLPSSGQTQAADTTVDYGGVRGLPRPRGRGNHSVSAAPPGSRKTQSSAWACGPEIMLRYVTMDLELVAHPGRHLHLDGAQHEVRYRPLRALPVCLRLRVQGWANFSVSAPWLSGSQV